MDSRDGQRAAGKWMPGPLDALAQRGIGEAVDLFVRSVDLNDIVRRVDLNAVLDQVDLDRLLQRVDVNALLARVDINAFLARVDVDVLLARVDVDALIDRVDLTAVIARSSAGAASETVDEIQEEAERLGDSAGRWADRLFHHDSEAEPPPADPSGTGGTASD